MLSCRERVCTLLLAHGVPHHIYKEILLKSRTQNNSYTLKKEKSRFLLCFLFLYPLIFYFSVLFFSFVSRGCVVIEMEPTSLTTATLSFFTSSFILLRVYYPVNIFMLFLEIITCSQLLFSAVILSPNFCVSLPNFQLTSSSGKVPAYK